MSEFTSVLDLARATASEANRIKSGQQAEDNAERVLNRVTETRAELQKLQQAIAVARRLAAASGVQRVDLTGLDDGRANLERLARQSSYLPSDLAFNAAKKKIRDVTSRVASDFEEAWAEWARQAVAKVPAIKISQLNPADQAATRARWEALNKVSGLPGPKTDDINAFKSSFDYLHELLDPLPDLPGEVQVLYDRLARPPALTLADITDEQFAQLRDLGLGGQIEVRRRGA